MTPFSGGPTIEKVSLVLENTCLAADLLMRLPDETSDRLKANNAWDAVFKWAINFALETGFQEYVKAGKTARESADFKGHPMGKKPDALLKMVIFRIADRFWVF